MSTLYKMVCNHCDTVEHFKSVPLEWRCDACDSVNGYNNKNLVARPNEPKEPIEVPADTISPNHYTSFAIAPNVYITANNLGWEVGNVIKYVSRYKLKNGLEDLQKAKKYIDLLIEREYPNGDN